MSKSSKGLDQAWDGWVNENLERQCNPEDILSTLLDNSFSIESIRQSMGDSFPIHSELLGDTKVAVDYAALSRVRITQNQPKLKVKKVETERLQIYEVDEFMSTNECDDIVAIVTQRMRPSEVTLTSSDEFFRTSSTCDLSLVKNALVRALDQKIARTLGVRLPYSEGIQAQRYEVGQEFKAHTDYFDPGTDEFATFGADRGNRTWTFMVYLNDVAAGGGTRFFALDQTFLPKKGKAVIWNNLYTDGTVNPDSVHAGLPVEVGQKIIITKWFREKGGGPMFFKTDFDRIAVPTGMLED